ncbi:MAG: hypothetical protein IKE94_16390 [Aeriscardovia sp.]|nr:hypothetical protein [Aeriscardovia sp.]MCR4768111.1 hypothetical protein [Saccharofermentans sp.]
MKKLVLVLSIAAMIGCMALPASAMVVQSTSIETQYQGSSMSDRGVATVYNISSFRCSVSLKDANGVKRGAKTWNCGRGSGMITTHTVKSYWVDHAYNNKSVDCKELLLGF